MRLFSALSLILVCGSAYALGTECWTYEYCSQTGCGVKCSDNTYYAMDCGADIFDNGFDIHESGGCNGVDPNSVGGHLGGYALTGIADPHTAFDALTRARVAFSTGAEFARAYDVDFDRPDLAAMIIVHSDLRRAQRALRRARVATDGGMSVAARRR